MRNMLSMDKRMTIWTNYKQIFSFIVFPIFIFVMNSKNFFYFIISANFTFLNNISFFPKFSKICSITITFSRSLIKSSAFWSAKFISFTWRTHKFYMASSTFIFLTSSTFLRSVIAQSRTIFCFITSRRNMIKFLTTNTTNCFNLFCASEFIFTFSRTIFGRIKSVYRYVKLSFTTNTFNKFSSTRFIHAAP